MLPSTARLASSSSAEKAVTPLKSQQFGRYVMHRGIYGKGLNFIRICLSNPRNTIGRFIKPALKLTAFSFVFVNFFETCYRMRLDPPWERYYREQAKS